jgi:hypothetical protein
MLIVTLSGGERKPKISRPEHRFAKKMQDCNYNKRNEITNALD